MKSNNCGELNLSNLNEEVTLSGWVSTVRDLGGILFIELRDRSGFFQLVANPQINPDVHKAFEKVRSEYVIMVKGKVTKRPEETYNEKYPTGQVEMYPESVEILAESKVLPFILGDDNVSEDIRLKYRYLDIRNEKMLNNLKTRHNIVQAVRNYLNNQEFLEVETPILIKTTPEGARDYLVPSRVQPGKFFALPQSPQIFKQLLMVGGIEKYYQIAKCFRDEDLRADRQPEFTQIDMEMSFVEQQDVIKIVEGLLVDAFKAAGVEIKPPFIQMPWQEAMDRYGSDKPDTRFELLLTDLSALAKTIDFKVFQEAEVVKAIVVKDAADKYSRKSIDKLTEQAKQNGAKGLAWVKFEKGEFAGGVSKFLAESTDSFVNELKLTDNDLVLFVADSLDVANSALGALRLTIGKQQGLIDFRQFNLLWVIDWPMFEWSDEEERYMSAHHPFTLPTKETQAFLSADGHSKDSDLKKVRAHAYDIVLNGYELGGGSLRINTRQLQEEMLSALGFKLEDANEQFGFLLEALDYGFPPHGGLALGLDRFVMLLAGKDNIREVIAFPKNNKASDPMTQAPSIVAEKQLEELSIKLANKDQ